MFTKLKLVRDKWFVTDRQTDRPTDRPTDRQTDRPTRAFIKMLDASKKEEAI